MSDDDDNFGVYLFLLTIFVVGVLCGLKIGLEAMKHDAIKRGYAQYNAETAKFEWKGE